MLSLSCVPPFVRCFSKCVVVAICEKVGGVDNSVSPVTLQPIKENEKNRKGNGYTFMLKSACKTLEPFVKTHRIYGSCLADCSQKNLVGKGHKRNECTTLKRCHGPPSVQFSQRKMSFHKNCKLRLQLMLIYLEPRTKYKEIFLGYGKLHTSCS